MKNKKSEDKPITIFPALDEYQYWPIKICEIAEALNKFCLYAKGTSGRIFKLYMEIIDRCTELLRLEKEKHENRHKQDNR